RLQEIVDALSLHGRFRDACRYAYLIKSGESSQFYSQRDWAIYGIAAALMDVKRHNSAERLIEKIQSPNVQVKPLCSLGLTLHSVAPAGANAVLQKATNIAYSIRNSRSMSDEEHLLDLCLGLYKVNAKDAPFVLEEAITAINRRPTDRDE